MFERISESLQCIGAGHEVDPRATGRRGKLVAE
jgi:hypothetical protein